MQEFTEPHQTFRFETICDEIVKWNFLSFGTFANGFKFDSNNIYKSNERIWERWFGWKFSNELSNLSLISFRKNLHVRQQWLLLNCLTWSLSFEFRFFFHANVFTCLLRKLFATTEFEKIHLKLNSLPTFVVCYATCQNQIFSNFDTQ